MPTFTWRERARYAFDTTMARGASALVGWLALGSLAMIGVHAALLLTFGLEPEDVAADGAEGFARAGWYGLMRAMDAGAVGGDAADWRWPLLLANLGVTLGGIFVLSTLIGILSNGLQGRIEQLRKGRSRVVEAGHTVILGWTPAVPVLLSELAEAHASDTDACVVILADADKVEVEDALREQAEAFGRLRVVVRSGDPTRTADLAIANVEDARAILVLHPGGEQDGDIVVLKTLLALFSPEGRGRMHIVAELRNADNLDAAKLVGGDELDVVLGHDLVARITVQTCRQPGLSYVHTDLLDFGGDEIYFGEASAVEGRTFGEALAAWRTCSVVGLLTAEGPRVLPPFDTVIAAGDRIIAIAADDSLLVPSASPSPDVDAIVEAPAEPARSERTLVLGWNSHAASIVRGLDAYVGAGSEVCVVDADLTHEGVVEVVGALQRQSLEVRALDPSRRDVLDGLEPGRWDHVVVLPGEAADPQAADARVLVTLLHLRDIASRTGASFSLVSEMNDVRNRDLAERGRGDDFIVSSRLVSLMMCQIAEQKELHAVLADLFDPDGAEIYLKPAARYVREVEVNFATLVESARRRGEVAIGYRLGAGKGRGAVTLNPDKGARVRLGAEDQVIVVAMD